MNKKETNSYTKHKSDSVQTSIVKNNVKQIKSLLLLIIIILKKQLNVYIKQQKRIKKNCSEEQFKGTITYKREKKKEKIKEKKEQLKETDKQKQKQKEQIVKEEK